MASDRQFNKFLANTLEDMRMIADNSKVLGDPIYLNAQEVIIPISKLTFGFGVGGSEFSSNKEANSDLLFETAEEFPYGGASLGGLIVNPEAFLYIKDGDVKVIKMGDNPNIYDKVMKFYKDFIKK